jgi:hypothetical protein
MNRKRYRRQGKRPARMPKRGAKSPKKANAIAPMPLTMGNSQMSKKPES